MTSIFASRALTPQGWARDVRVAIDADGRIASVSPEASAQAGDQRLDGALLPAPGNLHSHAFQRAMAGMNQIRGPGADSFWSWRELMYRFLERITPDQAQAIAEQVFVETLEAGFAAMGEFHYLHHAPGGGDYDDIGEMSARICAAAAETGIGLTHLPVYYAQGSATGAPLAGGQLRFGCDRERFARLCDSARRALSELPADAVMGVAPHSLRAAAITEINALAAETAGPVHIHIAEQQREVAEIEAAFGARPVAYLLANASVDARWCLIHATHMTPDETEAAARSGAVAGLCPITEADLGDGIFDGPRWLAAGGAVGVGSDSNIRIDLAEELRLLEQSQRYRDRARCVLAEPNGSTGRRLFDAVCAGGARALGRDGGAIVPGAWADLVALDLSHPGFEALEGDRILDAWIFNAPPGAVRDVWSAGRYVVTDGRHVARDAVAGRFRAAVKALRA